MWARSHRARSHTVWHRVTRAAWHPDVLQLVCHASGVLRVQTCAIQAAQPGAECCPKCLAIKQQKEQAT